MRVWLAQLEVSSNGSTIRKCKRREYELGLCCEFMNHKICKRGEKEKEKSGYILFAIFVPFAVPEWRELMIRATCRLG